MKPAHCLVIKTPHAEELINLEHVVRATLYPRSEKSKGKLEIRLARKGCVVVHGAQADTLWNLLRDRLGGGPAIELDGSESAAPLTYKADGDED